MSKSMKSFRIEDLYYESLSQIAEKTGLSKTDVLELAVSNLYSMYFNTIGKVVDKSDNELIQALEFKRFYELNH